MDITASKLVPHLVQQLCEGALQGGVDFHSYVWELPIYDLHIPFQLPNTTGCGLIEHMDRQSELLSLACKYATRAFSSFAENMSAEIRNRRNQLLPVYRLLSETLAMIFQSIVDSDASQAMSLSRKAPFNISHVSRRWRDVAINAAQLWTTYDATNARIANVILDRSKLLPLDIELVISPTLYRASEDEDPYELRFCQPMHTKDADVVTNISDLIRPALPRVNHWRSMTLDGVNKDQLEICIPREPAPNLRKLHIIGAIHRSGLIGRGFAASHFSLFDEWTPLLRDLHLACINLPLTSSVYVGLISLELRDIHYDETASQFLRTIANCPLLEHLVVRAVKVSAESADPQSLGDDGRQLISLPHLGHMKLGWLEEELLRDIVSSIIPPPQAQLDIQVHGGKLGEFCDVFPSTGFLSNIHPIGWVYFRMHAEPNLGAHLVCEAGDFVHGRNVRFTCLDIFPDFIYMNGPTRMIPYLTQGLPVELESLAFEIVHPSLFSATAFTQLLIDTPTITSLTLSDCPWPYVEALVVSLNAHLCPRLAELRLQGLSVVNETLLEIARSRTTGGGTQLTRLVLSQCDELDPSTLVALQDLPLEVHVLQPGSYIEEAKYGQC